GAYYKRGSEPASSTDGTYTTDKPFTASASAEGGQTIYVWLKDVLGNVSHNNRSSTLLNYDATPPPAPVSLTATPSGWTNTNSFSINWTSPSDISGIAGAYYKVGSAPGSPTDGTYTTGHPFTASVTAEGGQTIYVWLKDGVGNVNQNNRSSTTLYYGTGSTPLNPAFTARTPTSLTVSWATVAGANYVAVLASDSGYSSIVSSITQSETTKAFSGLSAGTSYYFEVKLATETDAAFALNQISTATTNPPTLGWTGEANYTADGLNPETGDTTTTFVYRVNYTDADNDAPASGYPKVHIKKGGTEISGSPFTMTFVSGAYNTGAVYTYLKTLSTVGTDYTYYFEAFNSTGIPATGTPTSAVDAPDIAAANNSPTLVWTGETDYTADGLNPETGDLSTSFVYRVKYTDADNDAPASGYPKVHIKKGGTEISGSPFTMTFVSGAYNTGAVYAYSKTLAAVGTDYTYYFEALDSTGAVATGAPTSAVDAPDVSEIAQEGNKTTLGDNLFNPRTGGTSKVKFNVPAAGRVSLKIYDLSGKLIRTLFDGDSNSGDMQRDWDGKDDSGRYVVPGVYFLHYIYPGGKEVRKIGVKR
ncbi:MAG: T9SS type A sorting domain-containing protein, partial [Elusimicrobia bacterium]|nr:T9SS type A sorting domain-containing protein [Elusimicrobiota bacterium]